MRFGSLASQGIYDVISHLGAVVVRLFFRLWEDASFHGMEPTAHKQGGDRRSFGLVCTNRKSGKRTSALFFAVFGPPLAGTFLSVVFGAQWSNAEAVAMLSMYCHLHISDGSERVGRGVCSRDGI